MGFADWGSRSVVDSHDIVDPGVVSVWTVKRTPAVEEKVRSPGHYLVFRCHLHLCVIIEIPRLVTRIVTECCNILNTNKLIETTTETKEFKLFQFYNTKWDLNSKFPFLLLLLSL